MKIRNILVVLVSGWFACNPPAGDYRFKNASFNRELRILTVNPAENRDTVLQQIIVLSNTRHEGYGILLAVGDEVPESQLNSWAGLFRKQDINAVHPIRIDSTSFQNSDRVAIEGARFVWLFGSPGQLSPHQQESLQKSLQVLTKEEGIIVADEGIRAWIIEKYQSL